MYDINKNTIAEADRTADHYGDYAHILGNGTSNSKRSNAHTIDWSGNAWFQGDVYVGSTSGTNKDSGSKKLATIDDISTAIENRLQSNEAVAVNNISVSGDLIINGVTIQEMIRAYAEEIILGGKW